MGEELITWSHAIKRLLVDQLLVCDAPFSSCRCELGPHSDGPHRCECGGMWEIVDGRVRIRAYPQRISLGHPGAGEPNPLLVGPYAGLLGREDLDDDGGPWPPWGPGVLRNGRRS